jgi:hypothetical protein
VPLMRLFLCPGFSTWFGFNLNFLVMKRNFSYGLMGLFLFMFGYASAQSGVTGLNTATSTLKTYVDPATNIALVIGGIVGIVGGIRVYSKWNSGDQDINKELMGWGGSCLFLVLSSLIVKAFFGL